MNFGEAQEAVGLRALRLFERYHAFCAHLAQQILPPHTSGSTCTTQGRATCHDPCTDANKAVSRAATQANLEVAHPTPRVGLDINAHHHPSEAWPPAQRQISATVRACGIGLASTGSFLCRSASREGNTFQCRIVTPGIGALVSIAERRRWKRSGLRPIAVCKNSAGRFFLFGATYPVHQMSAMLPPCARSALRQGRDSFGREGHDSPKYVVTLFNATVAGLGTHGTGLL